MRRELFVDPDLTEDDEIFADAESVGVMIAWKDGTFRGDLDPVPARAIWAALGDLVSGPAGGCSVTLTGETEGVAAIFARIDQKLGGDVVVRVGDDIVNPFREKKVPYRGVRLIALDSTALETSSQTVPGYVDVFADDSLTRESIDELIDDIVDQWRVTDRLEDLVTGLPSLSGVIRVELHL